MRHYIDPSGIACGLGANDPTLETSTAPGGVDCPRCNDAIALGLPRPGLGIRVYVATGFERASTAFWYGRKLQALGCEWTYDWTERALERTGLGSEAPETSIDELRELGEAELDAVCRADVVLVLLPGGRGTHVEMGAAIALGKRVILLPEQIGPGTLGELFPCPFYRHPAVEVVAGPDEAIAAVVARPETEARGAGSARHVYVPETLSGVEIANPSTADRDVLVHALGTVSAIKPGGYVFLTADLDTTVKRVGRMLAAETLRGKRVSIGEGPGGIPLVVRGDLLADLADAGRRSRAERAMFQLLLECHQALFMETSCAPASSYELELRADCEECGMSESHADEFLARLRAPVE